MNPANSIYDKCKIIAESVANPCAIMQVKRDREGNCEEIIIFATNPQYSLTGEDVEGHNYVDFIPREPEFEDMCVRAAFGGEKFHTYVDTTKMLGGWSDNLILPLKFKDEEDIGYCQFIYEMNKAMEPEKFSTVSPLVAGFIIQCGLTLRENNIFEQNIDKVSDDIRQFTGAKAVCIISADFEKRKAKIMSLAKDPTEIVTEQFLANISIDMAESWSRLIGESNCFIMRDKSDLERVSEAAPEWAHFLKLEGTKTICLIPIVKRNMTLGFLILNDFPVEKVTTIKESLELVAILLASEFSNHQFIERLEWLTSVDLLTGVRNRATMNRVVDEYAEQLKWKKFPFGVAFCTMNGMRALNDKYGHDAGNKCLEKAGEILRSVFDETEIFRSSGEEFAIVAMGMDAKDFEEKIEKLRVLCSDPDGVYFAIGTRYDEETGDIRQALRNASRDMLTEKAQFYIKYPEKDL
ncbi:GGDEF domain-containing protein [Butyrivibrio sp. NC2002]|uniref:GGDEF domain-containing protein n=1 Tax=Butyrivibrio sp. NC2002 TaxID=1410610 RepID=UPI00056619AC|nr:GGDEF domain-containing protein [Butyrivibrio sp. NC2002]